MVHTPRKARPPERNDLKSVNKDTPYLVSPSPPHQKSNAADSAALHANFLQNQFARDTSSDDISRSPSLTKATSQLNNQSLPEQDRLRQHSLIREQLERKNREIVSKIDDYQEEVGISRVLPHDQTYGTNSTFKRDSTVMPHGIHEASQQLESILTQQRDISGGRSEFIAADMVGTFAKPANLNNHESDPQMWDDAKDESPGMSNGQQMRASTGLNDEYVDWLETNSKK